MSPVFISLIIFAIVFVGSLLGIYYRSRLAEHHLTEESRDFVLTVGLDLAGVIAAFVLALVVAAAQSNFTERRSELMEESSKILLLNQILNDYGPETKQARVVLRHTVVTILGEFWPDEYSSSAEDEAGLARIQTLYDEIVALKPRNDSQRSLRDKALDISFDLEQTRDLLIVQKARFFPKTFIIVLGLLVFWFVFIFFSLGIYAPSNSTVVLMLILSALSVAIAFFVIIDLNLPFEGILRMPSAPLRETLQYIG